MALTSVFQSFRDTTLVFKLTGGLALILLFFFLTILFSDMDRHPAIPTFEPIVSTGPSMADHAEHVGMLWLTCQKNEKEFLLSQDKQFADLIDNQTSGIQKELGDMARLAEGANTPELAQNMEDIRRAMDRYMASIHALIASFKKMGLDQTSGLQDRLKEAGHQMEQDMIAHDLTPAYLALIHMRNHEKDYIRTWSSKYKPMMVESFDTFREALNHTVTDDQAMAAIKQGFDTYEQAFQHYFTANEKTRPIIYEEIRSAARDMGNGFKQVYIPGTLSMILTLRKHEKDYLLTFDPAYAAQVQTALDDISKTGDAAPVLDRHKDDLRASVTLYRQVFDALVNEHGLIVSHRKTLSETVSRIESLISDLTTQARDTVQDPMPVAKDQAESVHGFVLWIAVAALVIGIVFAFLMTRHISRTLSRLTVFAQTISRGDFSKHLDISGKDEIGSLASAMNTMTVQVRNIFEKIANDVGQLKLSSDELFGVSSRMAQGTSELSGQSGQVRGSSDTLPDLINRVSVSQDEASSHFNLLATAIEALTTTVQNIGVHAEKARAMTEDAVQQVTQASLRIDDLGTSAKDIDAVTDTIEEISDQTNLLALNATIEAARAGEYGKGFAVVAHEIKELACQTAESTRLIRTKIEGIQGASNQTIKEIGHIASMIQGIADVVSQVSSGVEEQAATTREIIENVSRSSKGFQTVHLTVDETSREIEDLREDMKRVNHISDDLSENSDFMKHHAKNLSEQISSLNTVVSGLTLLPGNNTSTESMSVQSSPLKDNRAFP